MTALIPILAVALVVLLKKPLGVRGSAQAAGRPATQAARTVVPDVQIAWTIPAPYEPGGRDPMRPIVPEVPVPNMETPVPAVQTPIELTVTGILYSDDKPAAIVDTQVVHVGQQVSGATVEKIEVEGVHFERNGRRWKQTVNR